jgi:hypothetical protein
MELYINSSWTKCYEGTWIAEAITWSKNGTTPRSTLRASRQKKRTPNSWACYANSTYLESETSMKTGGSEES